MLRNNAEFLLGFAKGIKGPEAGPALVEFLFLLGDLFQ